MLLGRINQKNVNQNKLDNPFLIGIVEFDLKLVLIAIYQNICTAIFMRNNCFLKNAIVFSKMHILGVPCYLHCDGVATLSLKALYAILNLFYHKLGHRHLMFLSKLSVIHFHTSSVGFI